MGKTRLFGALVSRYSDQSRIVRYTLTYCLLSCIWIGFSDRVLLWTVSDPGLFATLSTIKGWFFVAATAALWHSLMTHSAKKITEAQSAYRTLIHASPIPIAVMKMEDGIYMEVNDSFVELSGYSKDEIVGHSILELGFYPDAEQRADILRSIKMDGRLRASDRRFRAKSGKIIETLLWVESICLEGKKYVLALALDLSERKNLQLQLLQAQRMETVGTLSAGVAHDFNNILNIIGGNIRLISEAPEDRKKNKDRMEAIARITERGARLVRQLQFFAGKSEHSLQEVDVNKILEENAKILSETFPKTVTVTLELDDSLPLVIADPNQLHQVFLNLSVNARDAMPGGGTVCFSTSLVDGKVLQERFQRTQSRPYVKIAVRDTGEGMDKETQRRIFDPFFTTKEVGRGTGLGLSVALGIVESHNGFIEVESEPGKGSEFSIFLPSAAAEQVQSETQTAIVTKPEKGSETILFVDDEEFGRELALDQFSEFGYTVLTASNGLEAVEKYRLHAEDISLVLSDFGLPSFDGEEVFKRLCQINPSVKFILLTGMIDEEKVGRLLQSGIRDIILKPYSVSELLTKIRELLDVKEQRP